LAQKPDLCRCPSLEDDAIAMAKTLAIAAVTITAAVIFFWSLRQSKKAND
jgi:hypothetical protein